MIIHDVVSRVSDSKDNEYNEEIMIYRSEV